MRSCVILIAGFIASGATADTCVTMQGSALVNECQACVELTLRQRAEQGPEVFTGDPRVVRLDAGARETLPAGRAWAIVDFKACP